MLSRYRMFAGYNAWANERLYAAAASLRDEDYRADRGAFFKSVHGTLSHLLIADRIWMHRLSKRGETYARLDVILCENLPTLRAERQVEDQRIAAYIGGLTEADLASSVRYRTITNPAEIEQELSTALDHFFNHQTHHRGQVHALLTGLAGAAPSLDLILYQRETGMGLK